MGGEEWFTLTQEFNAGSPLDGVEPEQWKKFWHRLREIQGKTPRPEGEGEWGATTVNLIAAMGGIEATLGAAEFFALSMRANLLAGLFERGVLQWLAIGGELSDSVFRAAATMPMTLGDLAESGCQFSCRRKCQQSKRKV